MVRPYHFLSTFPLADQLPVTAPWYLLPSSGSGWNLLLLLTFPSPSLPSRTEDDLSEVCVVRVARRGSVNGDCYFYWTLGELS